jgi:uncharacterized protein (DUF58 family)
MSKDITQAIHAALSAAGTLRLSSPVNVSTFEGRQTTARSGGAVEFLDHRAYRQGDPLQHIDWRLYARNEQLMVRRFAKETALLCDVIIDGSASMGFYGKGCAAAGLAALFAQSALNGGFTLQTSILTEGIVKLDPPENPLQWDIPDFDHGIQVFDLLQQTQPDFFRNGLKIFISDLLFETPPEKVMEVLGGKNCIIIQLLGQEELFPAVSGPVTLTDPESGKIKMLHADETTCRRYREKLTRFQAEWERVVSRCGSRIFFFDASVVLKTWELQTFCQTGVLQ